MQYDEISSMREWQEFHAWTHVEAIFSSSERGEFVIHKHVLLHEALLTYLKQSGFDDFQILIHSTELK
jgi:hypothetical protein